MVQRICLVILLLTLPTISNAKKYSKSPIPYDLEALDCLALNLYYESRSEASDIHIATTGFVTMQRVYSKHYPNDVCSVVYELRLSNKSKRWTPMYSWTKDGESDIPKNFKSYDRCLRIAKRILNNNIKDITQNATHYHNTRVEPYWADDMIRIAKIGNHIFYR